MTLLDWVVVAVFCLASIGIGLAVTKQSSQGVESYFASDRSLSWWLAGTSMAATAFSSDTPLLVTGIVRERGVWGNWEIWALSLSTMFAVFFFSKLWKRAGVLTEVELVELRYDGRAAAFLRGFKAIYWGVLYNAFVMGAWPVTGLTKVMQETTGWGKAESVFFCMGLTAIYTAASGYWGVILTDLFQFVIAMFGAVLLAVYAVNAAGGIGNINAQLAASGKLALIPPASGDSMSEVLSSPFGWMLGLVLIQWWAWKNTDGGGIIVQRIASCKNERHAVLATLWFNIAQYALRAWPWILTALASLILLPDLTDHERAYPRLITMLLPSGLRGLMVASFFAAFMSTMSTHLNWGSSYFVNDFYRRFVKRKASEAHYIKVSRTAAIGLAVLATCVAFMTESIARVYTFILNFTAAVGPVYLLRWFWWRINPASEIAAMIVSLPIILLRHSFFVKTGLPEHLINQLLFMILGAAAFWVPATFLTPPASRQTLDHFYSKASPPGFWQNRQSAAESWIPSLKLWILGTLALGFTTAGPLKIFLGNWEVGLLLSGLASACWIILLRYPREPLGFNPRGSRGSLGGRIGQGINADNAKK